MTEPAPARQFARQTSAEHHALEGKLQRLAETTQGVQAQCKRWLDQLLGLRQFLQSHFAAEERDGYFGHVVQHAPWLKDQVDRLYAQHAQLAQALDQLTQSAQQLQDQHLSALAEQLAQWAEQLLRHEHAENRLLQEAFTQDTAEGD